MLMMHHLFSLILVVIGLVFVDVKSTATRAEEFDRFTLNTNKYFSFNSFLALLTNLISFILKIQKFVLFLLSPIYL